MAIAKRTEIFSSGIEKIWNTVTSCDEYAWRSDLSNIQVIEDGKRFVEYTKDGYATYFTITVFEPCKRYEFDMENDNMSGHWAGVFGQKDNKVIMDFTEEVVAKKIFMKPFVGMYLKRQQALYLRDLKKALGE